MPTVWIWQIEWVETFAGNPKHIPAGDIENALAKAKELGKGYNVGIIRGLTCIGHFQVATEEMQQELFRVKALF